MKRLCLELCDHVNVALSNIEGIGIGLPGTIHPDKQVMLNGNTAIFIGKDISAESVHWDFIRMAFASIAAISIIPMQDILGFGEDCRMNKPSTTEGNWHWRCAARFMNKQVCERLRDETNFYGRC